ncbi:hypothetical protein JG688_00015146 [Phytophthora aleatoria]|uniref:Uncharacterized protein n=1 Tax=Phytophthora aleatoria TaxID=2496075 RepID=A0A8J5IZT9_9STRA|nr:hypothetical protein JG688_00015146 [Phytophthora aleatoria]
MGNSTHVLHELGVYYLKGKKRHIDAESERNVAFRAACLSKKLANRAKLPGPNGSVRMGVARPEFYLDESFYNVNHVSGKTWLTSRRIRYGRSGKGPRGSDDEEDYRGNFDANLFELWFLQLCQTLQSYGACNIYMGDASYHKCDLNKSLRKKLLKADTQDSLQPVELVYGTITNCIAMNPDKNGKGIVAKVVNELEECSGGWMKVYRHVQAAA